MIFKFTLENLFKELNSTSSSKVAADKAGELLANLSQGAIKELEGFTPEKKERLSGELDNLARTGRETLSSLQKKFATSGLTKVFNPARQSNIKQTFNALAEANRLLDAFTATASAAARANTAAPVGPAKSEALDRLEQVKGHFKALSEGNWSPGPTDDQYDAAVLPVMVAAENARSPGLQLRLLPPEQDFATWLKQERPSNARVMFTIPGHGPHNVAADIRRVGGKTSVLVIEPLSFVGETRKRYEETTLPQLKKSLGPNVSLSVLTLDTQKSTNDCRIFALSAASKLADSTAMLDAFHRQNLSGSSIKTSSGGKAEVLAGDGKSSLLGRLAGQRKIRVLDGKGIVPATFVKHSQSSTTIANWSKANARAATDTKVNKAGQSLSDRTDSHKVTRYDKPVHTQFMRENLPEIEVAIKALAFSDSIEKKRLVYLDRAIAHLKQAPDAECANLLASMGTFGSEPPGPHNLHLEERDWGPHPDGL